MAVLAEPQTTSTPAGAIVDGDRELFNVRQHRRIHRPLGRRRRRATPLLASPWPPPLLRRGPQLLQMKMKAHQTIWSGCAFAIDARAAKQARDSARRMLLRPRSSAGAMCYIATNINKDIEPYCNSLSIETIDNITI